MHLLAVLACLACVSVSVAALTQQTVMIVSLDGMAWQFINASNTPNLESVAKEGVKAKYIKTVTPTKTWPNHQSFMTGLYSESHGIVSNTFWDPVYKEMFVYEYDCSMYDTKFFNASEPIWLTFQNQGGRSGIHFWPGFMGYTQRPTYYEKLYCKVNCSAIDPKDLPKMRNRTMKGWPPYIHCYANYTAHSFKSRIDTVVGWLKSNKPPKFVALYIDEPDWKGHEFGPDSTEYLQAVKMVDRDVVGYLVQSLKSAELLDKVNLMFVSDHSFSTVSSARQIFLEDYLDPTAYLLSDSGALGHIWPNEGKLGEIYKNLTKVNNPQMTVYKKEDIPESFHWKHNRRIPPIFVDPKVGWLVTQSRDDSNWTAGSHGWPAEESNLYAVFVGRGPAFREGFEVQPFNTVDLYPLMCRLLGIEPRSNNGSFENVKGILKESTTAGQKCSHSFAPHILLLCMLVSVFI